jgi:N-acyl-D-aspartate/D-glutamate deacylase
MTATDIRAIRNAVIYDGSGGPPRLGDIVVESGRIVSLAAPGSAPAAAALDVDGLAACPGFIDIHGHSDAALAHPEAPDLLGPFLQQGITTQVIGNCGLGVAPATATHRDALATFMALIVPRGTELAWESFAEYLHYLETVGPPLNIVPLAAHGAIRCAVKGTEPGVARREDLAAMGGLVQEALNAGAFGLSAGLIYPPGMWADTDELAALCVPVAAVDGLFGCHVRGSSELAVHAEQELLEIGRRTGVRLQHSHHEAFGAGHWHLTRETMRLEDTARRNGVDVASDVIPYHAVNTTLLAIYPPWALADGVPKLCERLCSDAYRRRILRDIDTRVPSWPPWEDGWAHNLVGAGGWDNIVLMQAASDSHRSWLGSSLTDIAKRTGSSPFECATEITAASGGDVMARYHGISGAPGDDDVLRQLLAHPHHAVAVDVILKGDGVPHPGGYGAIPRVLGHYARDEGWFDLSEGIRKATSLPAERLRLTDRGRLAPGYAADIVLFDPRQIGERGTWTEPHRKPSGIHAVLVNGKLVVRHGARLPGRPGVVLRRPQITARHTSTTAC